MMSSKYVDAITAVPGQLRAFAHTLLGNVLIALQKLHVSLLQITVHVKDSGSTVQAIISEGGAPSNDGPPT